MLETNWITYQVKLNKIKVIYALLLKYNTASIYLRIKFSFYDYMWEQMSEMNGNVKYKSYF